MKEYSALPKVPTILELHHQIVLESYQRHSMGGGSYPSAAKQSVYSTNLADSVNWSLWCVRFSDRANHTRFCCCFDLVIKI